MKTKAMHTPDREINEPEDDRFEKCSDCKGEGKIRSFVDNEEDGDFYPETERCPTCKGEGVVEKEKGGEDW